MRFDDRLATVLHQPVQDAHDRAVRWRQLVDLVARAGAFEHSPIVAEALRLIAADAELVPEHLRAAAARAVAGPAVPFEMVRYFAAEPIGVAVPVLAAVQLSDEQWRQLLPDASPEVARFIATLHPGIEAPAAPVEPPARKSPPAIEEVPSIGDVVARVERRRQEREARPERQTPAAAAESPAREPGMFRWECDPEGVIDWVEGVPRGTMIGRSIARRDGDEGAAEEVERAFVSRAPFREVDFELAGDGQAAGRWKVSGIPAFSGGRFVGYRGLAVREGAVAPGATRLPSGDPHSLRELVHELKTPLNAIIGFAEIIEAQMLGAADEHTRARAGEIVAQARLLLTAIDDLDFAARLQAERGRRGPGADLAALLEAIIDDLADLAQSRGAWLDVEPAPGPLVTNVEPALAERLVRRFCRAIIDRAGQGEQLQARADREGAFCRVAVSQPRGLAGAASPELELRLVRGLARVIGGDVSVEAGSVLLALPAA